MIGVKEELANLQGANETNVTRSGTPSQICHCGVARPEQFFGSRSTPPDSLGSSLLSMSNSSIRQGVNFKSPEIGALRRQRMGRGHTRAVGADLNISQIRCLLAMSSCHSAVQST